MLSPDRNMLSPPLIQRRLGGGGGGGGSGGLSMAKKALLDSPLSMMLGRPSHPTTSTGSPSISTGKHTRTKTSCTGTSTTTKMSPTRNSSITTPEGRENTSPRDDVTDATATITSRPEWQRQRQRRVSWSEELTEVRIVPSRKVVQHKKRGASRGLAFRSPSSSSSSSTAAAADATARRIKATPRTSSNWHYYCGAEGDDDAIWATSRADWSKGLWA